nr:MAG TPA: hypothetical protein [Caudoviricetes sp.]
MASADRLFCFFWMSTLPPSVSEQESVDYNTGGAP